MAAHRIVVMGVAASGKTTLGAALAERLGLRFVDADDAHPQANIDKMSAGVPLDDGDRWPWLARLTRILADATPTDGVVVTCSALKRVYRDQLRWAGDVVFMYPAVGRDEVVRRIEARTDHFMGPEMVDSQFAALEEPDVAEPDVLMLPLDLADTEVLDAALAALAEPSVGVATVVEPRSAIGSAAMSIDGEELERLVDEIADRQILGPGHRRVLLVPPDHTRLHSRSGPIAGALYRRLVEAGREVAVLPALGTHATMTAAELDLMFGDAIPADAFLVHDWRDGLTELGVISAEEVEAVSDGRFAQAIPVAVSSTLLHGWDLVVSIGQVVPHEVIGMANYTKNIVIGLGGAPTIHRSHQLGALCDMETIMGRVTTPVRQIVDTAFDRHIAPQVDVLFVLTVMEETADGIEQRGLFVGGADAFRAAASLATEVNVTTVAARWNRVSCWLDPEEFHSTWLGNKAVYRTRMAIADGGELIVLAPAVSRFGEDAGIDALIRRHGYRGTPATRSALDTDPQLAASLSAAAHLIHGSSEGRFRITYCTDPDAGGLRRDEVEAVGFGWRPLSEELARLGVDGSTPTGRRTDLDGAEFEHIANPALGLWMAE
ncbi:MAG: gluconokinase, GntK/IdnK-type [Actinomycetota bacterium]